MPLSYRRGMDRTGAAAVARRAVELGAANGVELPADLALWRLASGRPVAAARGGDPEELGEQLEAGLPEGHRRSAGVHYTPRALATDLAERAVSPGSGLLVGDPSCGGGALLLAAGRHLARQGEDPAAVVTRLFGMDIDPLAVATTEAALTLWAGVRPPAGNLVVADALDASPAWPPLDVVVGNPPFLGQLDADTARAPAATVRRRARFGEAVRAYTDDAGLFLLAACDLARPGGRVALLQPQSVLGARDASGVRAAVAARGRLSGVWVPADPGFDAAVDVCVPLIEVGPPSAPSTWSAHLARAHRVPPVDLDGKRTLGDEATTTAAFRSEYYGMVDHVHEATEHPAGRPLVTTGLVDLGGVAWGDRPARIGGRRWVAPVVDVPALAGRAADWARRTYVPKLVVASQTRVVEVAVDEDGAWVAGVPLVVVLAPVERLWALAAALAAPGVSAWLLQQVAGTGLTAQSLRVSAALLRTVPLPTDPGAWARGTAAFRAGDQAAFADAMSTAYGTGAEVAAWWSERATTVWSPAGARR